MDAVDPPAGYESELSPFKACLFDSYCGEPIAWGFELKKQLGEDRFQALRQFGKMECSYPKWFLIVRELSREEAVLKYGEVTAEEFGPRGGWKSVTFGTKKFLSPRLKK
jgi:hypothetical protein